MNKCPSIFYSWPNWGRRKAFFEWTRIDLASKPSLTFGGNVNYYKCLSSYSYSACGNREHRGNIRGNIRSPFNWVSRYILFLSKLKRGSPFLEGARRESALCDESQEHLAVTKDEKFCPFVKFEIILLLFCCFLDLLTIKHCRSWSSMINLWIYPRTCQKYGILLSARQTSNKFTL